MASTADEIKQLFHEMRSAHEELLKQVDKKIENVRGDGTTSPETEQLITKLNTAVTQLRAEYEELIKESQRPRGVGEVALSAEDELRQEAFGKYLRYGVGAEGRASYSEEEYRALSSSSDSDGGFLVPVAFESGIITEAYNEAELRPLCNVAPTGRDVVQLSAISKPVVSWGTQNLAISPQQLSAGGSRITIYDLKALTLISNNTLEDALADVWGEISSMFAEAVAEAEDDAFATAPGNAMPQGVAAHPLVQANYTPSLVANALSDGSNNGVDQLITMLQSLKKTYRRNATWAMNSTTEGDTRKLKNSQGDYLWQPPVQPGNPAMLLGRPIVNPESLPDVAANSLPILLGDFRKGYKVRDRKGLTVQRLIERYADYDQTGFIVKKRTGGQVVLPEAFRVLKIAVS